MARTKRKTAPEIQYAPVRPEYTAAVRYLDGSRDIFHVRNADDIADARLLVLSELGDVRSIMLCERR